jgi:SAM-dependent methyltransferase
MKLALQVAGRRCLANAATVPYYRKWKFLAADLLLGGWNVLDNPYRVYRRYRCSRGEDPYTYGDTPIPLMAQIAQRCRLTSNDICLELGCGTGRAALWLHAYLGCTVWAIDQVPAFIRRAKQVQRLAGLSERLTFVEGDFTLTCPASGATFAYVASTCLPEPTLCALADRLADLPSGARLISVTHRLDTYRPDAFRLVERFDGEHLWGTADIFHQVRI